MQNKQIHKKAISVSGYTLGYWTTDEIEGMLLSGMTSDEIIEKFRRENDETVCIECGEMLDTYFDPVGYHYAELHVFCKNCGYDAISKGGDM